MLVSIWLIGGLALMIGAVVLVVAMRRAERRARRVLFRALGLDEPTIDLLMARNDEVLAELARMRRGDAARGPSDAAPIRPNPAIRRLRLRD